MSNPSSAASSSESALPDVAREEFLLQKAAQHSRQRRFDLALQDCEELLHLDSSHPQALRIKACVSEACISSRIRAAEKKCNTLIQAHQEWGKAAYCSPPPAVCFCNTLNRYSYLEGLAGSPDDPVLRQVTRNLDVTSFGLTTVNP